MTNDQQAERGYVAATSGTVSLSGAAMREFLEAVLERGAPFRFTARGCSMYPAIKDRDVITVSPLGGRAPGVGEVVAFRSDEERLVVHRIVAVAEGFYELRGDNCPMGDGRVSCDALLGVVTRVESHAGAACDGACRLRTEGG